MQLNRFTLLEYNLTKNKLSLFFNYGLEVTIKRYWFITIVTVKKHDNLLYCVGFNGKNLLSQYHQGEFDACIDYCLSRM